MRSLLIYGNDLSTLTARTRVTKTQQRQTMQEAFKPGKEYKQTVIARVLTHGCVPGEA